MSSKIVGWLVGSGWQNYEIMNKSGIKKKSLTKSTFICSKVSRIFQEFPGFSEIQELVV